MSIFETLTREHEVMRGLVARVEKAFRGGDAEEGRRCLLILYHALALHEEIENLVCEPAEADAGPALASALLQVERQHEVIENLRDETRDILDKADLRVESVNRLRVLVLLLARRLRAHFRAEEMSLWPLLSARCGRSVGRSLDRRALQGVADLERSVNNLDRTTAEYL